jgi:hypothetical protein
MQISKLITPDILILDQKDSSKHLYTSKRKHLSGIKIMILFMEVLIYAR